MTGLGVTFLLRAAWTMADMSPDRAVDLPMGPLGQPLQMLRQHASRLADDFMDSLNLVRRMKGKRSKGGGCGGYSSSSSKCSSGSSSSSGGGGGGGML